ncbi:MAG: trypsin-like peptidase domain-containing protein [Verrucomicrobia bacterium]|nr:trypsin-like peptidase domain-containing protein [Verrucomicrobiota bacterium]
MSVLNRVPAFLGGGTIFSKVFAAALFANTVAPLTPKDIAHQLNDAYTAVYDKVAPTVVVIDVEKDGHQSESHDPMDGFDFFFRGPRDDGEQPDQSEGSGFISRSDGYIITNNHVIEGADKILVKLKDGRSFSARVIGVDDRTDISVIKIEASGLPVATFADSDQVKVGELVCAIGTPYKFAYTFTTGVVSAKSRNELLSDKYEDYIQTDAAINPGNSGGPLCDIDGQVIGINTLIHGLNRGLGFAISSNLAKKVSEALIASGRIVRPWLGIIIESLDDQNPSDIFKGLNKGVVVRTVQADTPAAKSDLRPADVITDVDGVAVANARDLQNEILKKKIGEHVLLGVWRNGRRMSVDVKTEELPNDPNRLATNSPFMPPKENLATGFGAKVEDVTPDLERNFGLKSDSGVVVVEVVPSSPAALADIHVGDLITEVGRTGVTNIDSFQSALNEQKGKPNLLLLLDRKGVKTYSIVKTVN